MRDEKCRNCGRPVETMCFRGTGACCANCHDALTAAPATEAPEPEAGKAAKTRSAKRTTTPRRRTTKSQAS